MEKLAVSITEAAELVGISRAGLYPRIMAGEIPSVLVGSRRLIPLDKLRAWLDAQPDGGTR